MLDALDLEVPGMLKKLQVYQRQLAQGQIQAL
jgi:hypothetical protein